MKKALFAGLALAALMSVSVFAEGISISVDTKEVAFSEDAAQPYIDDGTTFVPLRGVLEQMGYSNIVWDAENRQAILQNGTGTSVTSIIVVSPDTSIAEVNGEDVDMGVQPQNYEGSLMIPLRAVAELADGEIDWDAETKSISITTAAAREQAAKAAEAEAAKAAAAEEAAIKEEEANKAALEEARANAQSAKESAEEEKNYDYTAYPKKLMEFASTMDAQVEETNAAVLRYYVNNATYITKYANQVTDYIAETEEAVTELNAKESQADLTALYNKYLTAAKKLESLFISASNSNFSGGSVSKSTKKGERTLGSTSSYQQYKNDYQAAKKELDAASEALTSACEKYLSSLS